MSIELYDAVNHDGLFDILGRAFHALGTLNTARLTTVPTEVKDFLAQFKLHASSAELAWAEAMEGLPGSVSGWQGTGSILSEQVRRNCERLVIQAVKADAAQPEYTLARALAYLLDQMEADGDYVDGNTVSLTLTPAAGNEGDAAIASTEKRGDGRVQENLLAESIAVEVTNDASAVSPTIQFLGQAAETNRLSHDWPKGSGARLSLTATDAAASLLSNGDFEDAAIADVPDDWIVHVGTPGATVKLTSPEVQTVAISGTPEGGSYQLAWTNPAGVTRSTATLPYNATAAAVESALRRIPGLEAITVSATGTSPDLTHTVTFTGVAGNVAQLTSVAHLTGGVAPAIAHGTTTAGDDGAYQGRALLLDSNGSEETALYHPLGASFAVETVYFLHFRTRRTGATAGGALAVEIVDGIGGSVVDDSAGNPNSLTIDATAISTDAHDSHVLAFRLPVATSYPVYLRVRIASAIDATANLYLDQMAVAQGRELYPGGPFLAAFSGAARAVRGDRWTLTAANNRAGLLQEWFARVFAMPDKGLLLPVAGTSLIPDAVVG